jgi:hypothetical protein
MVTFIHPKPKQPNMSPSVYGEWTIDYHRAQLRHVSGYPIALDEATTSAQVLDWIAQVSHKNWATPKTVGELVTLFDAILQLQANLCSGGQHLCIQAQDAIDLLDVFRDSVKNLNAPWQLDKLEK